ncbi:MAG: hypothetical protein CL799_02985 [Chromatiales bacterium]|nr:hypothetical protein [Chromatiales bacterium]
MKRLFAFVAVSIGLMVGGIAQASAPVYDYLEFAWGDGEIEFGIDGLGSADIDQDGFEIEGSMTILDGDMYLVGSYYDVDGDEFGLDIDTDGYEFGAGWIFNSGDNTSYDVSVRFRDDEYTLSDCTVICGFGLTDDADGLGFVAGVRSNVTDNVELFGRIGYYTSDYEGTVTLDLGAVFAVSDNFAISVSYEDFDFDDDGVEIELDLFQIGARWYL